MVRTPQGNYELKKVTSVENVKIVELSLSTKFKLALLELHYWAYVLLRTRCRGHRVGDLYGSTHKVGEETSWAGGGELLSPAHE